MRYLILLLLPLLLVGCVQEQKETDEQQFLAPMAVASEVKFFDVSIYDDVFDPSTITVNEGDTVKLRFIAEDDDYGVVIDAFNVYTDEIFEGETLEVSFVADKAGTFSFVCNEFCSDEAQEGAQGSLVVLP